MPESSSPSGPALAGSPATGPTGAPASVGPLDGVRVIELAGIGPAPLAATMLAEFGADVLRVDRRPAPGGPPPMLARGRRSIAVDLKDPASLDAVRRLAGEADVFIEPFRPGVAERLGLGPEDLLTRNPALVYARMTGWGQQGPWALAAGHDINYIAITGALSAIGRAGGPPQVPLNLLGDFGGGSLYLVAGVLAALLEARRSGEGQVVDCAIVDGVTSLASMIWEMRGRGQWNDERGTNPLDTGAPYYDVYQTSDGGWFTVGAIEPQFYARLVELLEIPDWAAHQHDRDRWPALRAAFATAFASRTRARWEAVFAGTDACAAPVLTWSEALTHPHMAARSAHVGATAADGGTAVPAPAPRFSRTPARPGYPTPPVGSTSVQDALDAWDVKITG